jgi:hypothetical protein
VTEFKNYSPAKTIAKGKVTKSQRFWHCFSNMIHPET